MRTTLQGTVRRYDDAGRDGSVLLDDGTEIPFDAAAFNAGGLRLLRSGQRVHLDLDDGQVSRITIVTLRFDGRSPAAH
jgi:cold shock CspA family protein